MAVKVIIRGNHAEEDKQLITAATKDAVVEFTNDVERITDADAVGGHVPSEVFGRATRLRWIHSWAAGPDHDLIPELFDSPVVLTSSKGNGAIPLAEQVMLLMLMLNRDALRWVRAQERHEWDHFTHGELAGLTCGIIGLGNSGIDLAMKAKAFHMRVLGVRRRVDQPAPYVDEVLPPERVDELLTASDFVVVTAPRTPETIGMLGEREFRAMKASAHFVCISRGGIADDAALLRALTEGWIAGAGIDAHGEEPLPSDSPFWTAPNTIVTPHNGATTAATRRRGAEIFAENLRRFEAGEELHNVVDKQAGY